MKFSSPLVAALTGAFLLVGCGAPAPTPTGPAASPTPVSSPVESATPSATAPAELTVDAFLELISGAEMKTYSMDMVMTVAGATPMEMTTSGTFDNSDPKAPSSHMKIAVSGTEMEMIGVGGEYFVKMAETGDKWVKVDADTAGQMAGSGSPDMAKWVADSGDAIESVELVGDDTVDGVAVKHYRLTMKPEALKDLGLGQEGTEDAETDYQLWVDADGFTRKLDVAVTGIEAPSRIAATISEINEPVDIKAPKDYIEAPA